jgi:hypothetical protein
MRCLLPFIVFLPAGQHITSAASVPAWKLANVGIPGERFTRCTVVADPANTLYSMRAHVSARQSRFDIY